MKEVETLSGIRESRMAVVEVNNHKVYRIHTKEDEANINLNLRNIFRKTNELSIFECIGRMQDMPLQPPSTLKKMNVTFSSH